MMEELTVLKNKGDHVLQAIRDLYFSKEDSDVTLVCDDEVRVKAHKFLLGVHSSVFKSVLLNDESPSCVALPGTKFEDLDVLLSLIYLRKSPDPDYRNNKHLLELMKTLNIDLPTEIFIKQEEPDSDELNTKENIEDLVIDENDLELSETDLSDLSVMPNEDIYETFEVKDTNQSPGIEIDAKANKEEKTHYFCDKCQKTFLSQSALEKHYNTKQHKETKEKCNVCKRWYRNEMMLKIHLEEHQEETVVDQNGRVCCNKCDKTFRTIYQLRDHKVTHIQGMFYCDICPSKFSVYHALKAHLKYHNEFFECDQCDKKYRTKYVLKEHQLSAHQGLRLKCNFCERGFSGSSNLAKHINADHLGIRYNCEQCSYSAKKKCDLKNHIDSDHPTEGSKLYQCHCGYKSYSERRLNRHPCRKRQNERK